MAPLLPSEVFRKRLVEVRKAAGYSSQAQLAERLADVGSDLNESAIARIESGRRSVKIDDVFAIGAALGVAPVHMLIPIDSDEEEMLLAPGVPVTVSYARGWTVGDTPTTSSGSRYNQEIPRAWADRWVRLERELAMRLGAAIERLADEHGMVAVGELRDQLWQSGEVSP